MSREEVRRLISERVRASRTRHGWTADDLAERARNHGLTTWTRSVVAAIENERRDLDVHELLALPEVLDMSAALVRVWRSVSARVLGGQVESVGYRSARARVSIAVPRDLEQKIARQLGVSADDVLGASRALWGMSMTEKRNAIAGEQKAPRGESERSRRARISHITADLRRQVAEKLTGGSKQ